MNLKLHRLEVEQEDLINLEEMFKISPLNLNKIKILNYNYPIFFTDMNDLISYMFQEENINDQR